MNIAYLISAHTDEAQLHRLILALHEDAEFFVHIDRKSDIQPFLRLITEPRVHFIEERLDVRWGTLVEVDYQMALIRAAVEFPRHFDRIFFLSGMDYPLWSNARITRWLEEQDGREILQGIQMDTPDVTGQQRTLYRVARPLLPSAKASIVARKLLRMTGYRKRLSFVVRGREWHLYKGSAWWCISQELAQYVLTMYREEPSIRRYFRNSFGQAETVIQTIAFNHPLWAQRCILSTGAYPGLAALTPLHHIVYEPVIQVMTLQDLPALKQSGRMFTRKLRSGVSDELVQELERRGRL